MGRKTAMTPINCVAVIPRTLPSFGLHLARKNGLNLLNPHLWAKVSQIRHDSLFLRTNLIIIAHFGNFVKSLRAKFS